MKLDFTSAELMHLYSYNLSIQFICFPLTILLLSLMCVTPANHNFIQLLLCFYQAVKQPGIDSEQSANFSSAVKSRVSDLNDIWIW